jgi:hypothetical protein
MPSDIEFDVLVSAKGGSIKLKVSAKLRSAR